MKRICLFVIVLILLLVMVSVHAEVPVTQGVENMPEAVRGIIGDSRWSGWKIIGLRQ